MQSLWINKFIGFKHSNNPVKKLDYQGENLKPRGIASRFGAAH
jgi:hypothetical protein